MWSRGFSPADLDWHTASRQTRSLCPRIGGPPDLKVRLHEGGGCGAGASAPADLDWHTASRQTRSLCPRIGGPPDLKVRLHEGGGCGAGASAPADLDWHTASRQTRSLCPRIWGPPDLKVRLHEGGGCGAGASAPADLDWHTASRQTRSLCPRIGGPPDLKFRLHAGGSAADTRQQAGSACGNRTRQCGAWRAAPGNPAHRAAAVSSNTDSSTGLGTCAANPAARTRERSSSRAWAVTAMAGRAA